jgi:DNA-binding MarR family transcriptional regulator
MNETQTRNTLQTLANFRYTLRQFLHFSEQAAVAAGLQPQQHQLLLQIAGAAPGVETTVSYIAERLGLRHNSAVELSNRCEEAGLIGRYQGTTDRRRVGLHLTPKGDRILHTLSADHARELRDLLPLLVETLTNIHDTHTEPAVKRRKP